jgi:hypothetical protein
MNMENNTRRIIDAVDKCVENKNFFPFPRDWLMRLPERDLVQAIQTMENQSAPQSHMDALEFLINIRRYHRAYLRNNELWGFLEQHIGENLELADRESMFFGLVIDIAGGRTGEGFTLIPITNAEREDTDYKPARLFRNIPPREGRQVMHVEYIDMDKTKEHHVAFSMILELPWLSHEELLSLEETFDLIDFFVKLPPDIEDTEEEIKAMRRQITLQFLGKPYDILRVAIVYSSDTFETELQRDLLVFFMDITMVVGGIDSMRETILQGFTEADAHRVMMIDYSPTMNGKPPLMNHLTERTAKKVLEANDMPDQLRKQWQANLSILKRIPTDQIGLMHTHDAMSSKHNFPFDITTLFDPSTDE